ncbi:hypothetical protein D6O16_21755 [Salmonella enterica]|nr:hypothetical protein [Salmonella enterica]
MGLKMAATKKAKAAVRGHQRLSGAIHCGGIMSVTSIEVNIQPTHKCSFCGKTNVEVAGVSICQKCVFQCVDIVFKYAEKTNAPTY